jgi:hypothetical protein
LVLASQSKGKKAIAFYVPCLFSKSCASMANNAKHCKEILKI